MSHLYPRYPGPLILNFQGDLGCVWVADFARLVRILPMYVVDLLQNQSGDLNLGSGPARGGGSSPPFRTSLGLKIPGPATSPKLYLHVVTTVTTLWNDIRMGRGKEPHQLRQTRSGFCGRRAGID